MEYEYLKETTDDWKAECYIPNHTYLLNKAGKCVAYIREGTDELHVFNKALSFDKRKRKFKKLTKKEVALLPQLST